MLGASCPVEDCYTPLMRNKQGKVGQRAVHTMQLDAVQLTLNVLRW